MDFDDLVFRVRWREAPGAAAERALQQTKPAFTSIGVVFTAGAGARRTPRASISSDGRKGLEMHWGRVLVGGFVAELLVFAVVFPVLRFFGQQAFLVSIPIASALMPFLLAIWVARRLESRFALHGALVGAVAALVYIGLAWGQPQPLLYQISHALKIAGGLAGGLLTGRIWTRVAETITPEGR